MSATQLQTETLTRYPTSLSINSNGSLPPTANSVNVSPTSRGGASLRPHSPSSASNVLSNRPSGSSLQPFDGITNTPSDPAPAPITGVSAAMIRKEQLLLAAVCTSLFVTGWSDASAGPLIPRMQEYYNIGYTVVSLIFVCNCVGFILAALLNMWLNARFGFGITITLGCAFEIIAYSIQSAKPPFPVMAFSYCFNGFGEGLQTAQATGLVAHLPTDPNTKMSILHGMYGLGAFASPLVATQFADMPERWSFHFLTTLGVALINMLVLVTATRFKSQEALFSELGVQPNDESSQAPNDSVIRQVMSHKLVHLIALFILVYVGTEVTLGGWIVTYLLHKRDAGPGAGYVSSGFFGGIALGRVGLIWVNKKIGQQRAIYFYSVIAIGLQLTIWLIPSLYENAIAVSLVGVVLGPFYPITMNITSMLLPRRVLTASIGWIASIGQTGSAAFPFIAGVMAEKYGVQTLQPLLVSLLAFMVSVWFLIPSVARRVD